VRADPRLRLRWRSTHNSGFSAICVGWFEQAQRPTARIVLARYGEQEISLTHPLGTQMGDQVTSFLNQSFGVIHCVLRRTLCFLATLQAVTIELLKRGAHFTRLHFSHFHS